MAIESNYQIGGIMGSAICHRRILRLSGGEFLALECIAQQRLVELQPDSLERGCGDDAVEQH